MTKLRRPTTFYNPHLLSRDELVAGFIARQPLLELLLDDVRRGGGQHHLLVGVRGTGKTTLLLRIAIAIEHDADLKHKAIALRFPEEQYNVARPSDFWLNCLDALADALEARRERSDLDDAIAALDDLDEPERAARALALLLQWSKRARKLLVLLVDNLDLILDRIPDDHWALRKALGEHKRLLLIGASSSHLEESFQYGSAFYEFFNVHELGALDDDEARRLLLHLAKVMDTPHVSKTIEDDPGRLKALLLLSGGTPRTLGLLHSVLASENTSTAEQDLEVLLDQVTPYYKARFDDLPAQSQQIVDAVALHWHPITAAECAAKTRLDVSLISAQFSRLVRQGVLEKLAGDGKLTFQIAERFFNIWYLMRASRRLRRTLFWLVASVQSLYGQEEVDRRASEMLASTGGDPARLLAFASAVTDDAMRRALEFRAIEALVHSSHRRSIAELLDLDGEDAHLASTVDRATALAGVRRTIAAAKVRWPAGLSAGRVADALCSDPFFTTPAKVLASRLVAHGVRQVIKDMARVVEESTIQGDSELRSAIGRGEIPSMVELATPRDIDAILPFVASKTLSTISVGLSRANPRAFDDDAVFDRFLSRHVLAPWAVVTAVGDQLAKNHGPLARRRLEQVLRAYGSTFAPGLDTGDPWSAFVAHGRASEVADLLEHHGWRERLLPVYEALRAAAQGPGASLAHLAPEVRKPAEDVLQELLTEPDRSRPTHPPGSALAKRRKPARRRR